MTTRPPTGWREVELRELLSESDERVGNRSDLPLLSVTKYDGAVLAKDRFSRVLASKDLSRYRVAPRNSVVIDPMLLWDGVIALQHRFAAGVVSPDYRVFHFAVDMDPKFFDYLAHSSSMRRQYARAARGTNVRRRRISRDDFLAIRVAVPPVSHQREIAARIGEVDEAIAAGDTVVQQMERVRGAVVERLLGEASPIRGGLPWRTGVLADHLREPIRNGYSPVCPAEPTGRWTLSLSAVTPEGFSPAGKKPAPIDDPKLEASRLAPGDIVVSRANGARERVGLAGVYQGEPADCSYPDLMMRVRSRDDLLPEFLALQLLSVSGRRYFYDSARGTASMLKINREMLEAFPVVVPHLDEQKRIVGVVAAVAERISKERAVVAERRRVKAALADALLSGKLRVRDAA